MFPNFTPNPWFTGAYERGEVEVHRDDAGAGAVRGEVHRLGTHAAAGLEDAFAGREGDAVVEQGGDFLLQRLGKLPESDARLDEGHTVERLCKAIDGMHKIPHNLGANDRRKMTSSSSNRITSA